MQNDYLTVLGEIGYVRQRWGEHITTHDFGYHRSVFFSPSFYECDVVFPESAMTKPRKSLNDFLFTRDSFNENIKTYIKIPVSRLKDNLEKLLEPNVVEKIVLETADGSTESYDIIKSAQNYSTSWCLDFR